MRKNRPKRKEMPQKTWANTFENIKNQYEHNEPQRLNRGRRIEEMDE